MEPEQCCLLPDKSRMPEQVIVQCPLDVVEMELWNEVVFDILQLSGQVHEGHATPKMAIRQGGLRRLLHVR